MVKSKLKNRTFAYLTAVFCTLLWGTAFPFIKLGYSTFDIAENDIGTKLLFAGFRFTLAGIMVLLFLCISKRKFPKIKKSDIIPIGLVGLVQTFSQYIFTYIGIGFTSGTNTSIITACSSFFTVLFAPLFFKSDKLTAFKIIGCVLGFLGVVAININGSLSTDTFFGDLLILFSTLSASSGNFFAKKAANNRNPIVVTAYQLIFGGLLLVVSGAVCGGKLIFRNTESVMILLWLAFVSAAAFALWTALLKYHPASKISVFNLLVPVIGTVLSGIMLGENVFRIETLVSLVLISLGIAAVNTTITFGKRKIK